MFPARNLVTVWSAPNYCYRCGMLTITSKVYLLFLLGNVASILALDQQLNRTFKIFNAVPETGDRAAPPRTTIPYFL